MYHERIEYPTVRHYVNPNGTVQDVAVPPAAAPQPVPAAPDAAGSVPEEPAQPPEETAETADKTESTTDQMPAEDANDEN